MSKRQRNLFIGGTLLAGSIAGAAYLYAKTREAKAPVEKSKDIARELVVRILKEIQSEMYSVLTNIAMISNQLKEQSRGRLKIAEIKEFLLHQNPQTKQQIKQISDSICEKHGLEEKDLRNACEITFADDKEIKTLLNEAKNAFEKAFTGSAPDPKTDIPEFLTPELTLNLMKNIMKESLFKIRSFLENLKAKGIAISYNNPQVLMGLQELNVDQIRKDVLIEGGLGKLQDSPLKVFQYACSKYSKEDPDNFYQKFMKLDIQNRKAMEALMQDSDNADLMIEAIGAHLTKESEKLVLSSGFKNSRAQKGESAVKKDDDEKATEEEALNTQIRTLQRDVSFQLKSALEESQLPQDMVDSVVNTVFTVFNNYNKAGEEPKKEESPKNAEQEVIVAVVPEEVEKVEEEPVAEVQKEEENNKVEEVVEVVQVTEVTEVVEVVVENVQQEESAPEQKEEEVVEAEVKESEENVENNEEKHDE